MPLMTWATSKGDSVGSNCVLRAELCYLTALSEELSIRLNDSYRERGWRENDVPLLGCEPGVFEAP